MAKKKHQEQAPKPAEFKSTPFSALKGVVAVPATPPAPVAQKKEPPPPADDDSENLFLQAMSGVTKLGGSAAVREKTDTPSSRQAMQQPAVLPPVDKTSGDMFLDEIKRLKLDVKFSDSLPADEELKPLSGNRLKQLKRGVITLDRQLDLHGLTRDEALQELPRFLRNAHHKGCAAVLVITGKGNNSPAEPVLQQAVSSWLRDSGRELVAEYTPAPREMGGSGAFVVFLRSTQKPADAA